MVERRDLEPATTPSVFVTNGEWLMINRLLLFSISLLLLPGLVAAQDGTIQGTVEDAETGEPLPGVNVTLPETQQGAATDAEGEYEITGVSPGEHTLQATFVGYQTYEEEVNVPAGETVTVDIAMTPAAVELEEVAVTALGERRQRDRLGSAQSSIEGAEVAEAAETGVIESLSAQASGLNIANTGGDPGAGARILIRGQSTIQGDNQPLIVVDGVPVSNETFGEGVGGVAQQSRLNDLNPSDIQSIEVLKGASAAALWGSRAQNGVIIVETQSGGFEAETQVSFQTKLTAERQSRSIDLQEEWGRGIFGMFEHTPTAGFSWGDRIADRPGGEDEFEGDLVAVGEQTGREYRVIPDGTPDNPHGGKNSRETFDHSESVFDTGWRTENSLSFSGGGETTRYYLSGSYTGHEGMIRGNSDFERTTLRLNAERQVSSDLSVTGNANFVRNASDRVQEGSNVSGLLLAGYRTPPDYSIEDYTVTVYPEGRDGPALENLHRAYRASGIGSEGPVYDNPLWTANRILNTTVVNRIQGKVEANYEPLNWLDFTARVGLDTYSDRRQEFFPIRNASVPDGQATEQNLGEHRINVDLMGSATQALTEEIIGELTAGVQFNHREFDNLGGSLNNFSNPIEHRSLSNAVSENVSSFTSQEVQRTASAFSELTFDMYEQLFVTLSGRLDQSSTFGPETDDTFFYPSIQANWHFHQTLFPDNEVLSHGALRGSAAQVGREPQPYQAFTYFSSGGFFDGFTGTTLQTEGYGGGFEQSTLLGNPFIEPERTTEIEGGIDLRFFNDRVTLSGTYYFEENDGVIFEVDVPPSSGFTSRTENAAVIENQGVEVDLSVNWLETEGFGWTTEARWWTNQNEVVSLAGVQEVSLGGFVSATSSLIEGEEFGTFWGNRWAREEFSDVGPNETVGDNGLILDENGFPRQAATQGKLGNPNADWRANLGNTLRFENLTLEFLWDFKVGGEVWNGTIGALNFFGRNAHQAQTTTVSAEQAEQLQTYGSGTIAELEPSAGDIWYNADDDTYTFRGEVRDFGGGEVALWQDYYWSGPGSGFTGPAEPYIEDGSYAKLREVSLGYNFMGELVQRTGLRSIDVQVTGRNLLIISPYNGVDPEINLLGPSNAEGLDYFNNPTTRNYQFTIQFNY